MAIEVKNTKDEASQYVKVLVHGPSGSGKTRLCATTGGVPIILSAEAGLLSIRGENIDFIEIKTIDDLREAYMFLANDKKYDWICIDSISEIAEVVLSDEKEKTKDPRKAYGEMADIMIGLIRAFRDLPKNVYVTAKQGKVKDEITGGILFGPSAPGQKIAESLPYYFDEVFALQVWKDADGNERSALQTKRDLSYEAKDRSGNLEIVEPANLGDIYKKLIGTTKKEK